MMKVNDKSEEESLHYLRQAIHADLQTDLENEKVQGFRSNSLEIGKFEFSHLTKILELWVIRIL